MPRPPLVELVQATWSAADSAIVGRLQLASYGRRIVSMAIQGPAASTLRIYRGRVLAQAYLVSSVTPAADRLYDSQMGAAPLLVLPGEVYTFAWSGGSSGSGVTAAATVTSEIL